MRIKAMMPKFPISKSHCEKKYIAANIFNDFNRRLQNCETKTKAENLLKKTKKANEKYLKTRFSFKGQNYTETLEKRLEDACKQRTMTIKSNESRKTRMKQKTSSRATERRAYQSAENIKKIQ
jgi:hypothetical protein